MISKKRTRVWTYALLLAAAVWWVGFAQGQNGPANSTPASAEITAGRMQAHVNFLASPQMKGRGTGTPELNKAANYIAAQFRKAGLEPLEGKSYFQKFSVTVGAALGKDNHAAIQRGTEQAALQLNTDYVPLNLSDSAEETLTLVFAGYGISAVEQKYDDYFHLDVTGKAVIVLRHEPQ